MKENLLWDVPCPTVKTSYKTEKKYVEQIFSDVRQQATQDYDPSQREKKNSGNL